MGYDLDQPRAPRKQTRHEQSQAVPPGCDDCHYTGWRSDFWTGVDSQGLKEIQAGPVRRCDCPRGRYLAQKDAERHADGRI